MVCIGLLTTLHQLLRLQNKEWWEEWEYKKNQPWHLVSEMALEYRPHQNKKRKSTLEI